MIPNSLNKKIWAIKNPQPHVTNEQSCSSEEINTLN